MQYQLDLDDWISSSSSENYITRQNSCFSIHCGRLATCYHKIRSREMTKCDTGTALNMAFTARSSQKEDLDLATR